jgi:type I restriction enzyme M protein
MQHENNAMNLSSTIKSIQDIMRKDVGVDGDAQRIGQLTWMLFLKVFDAGRRVGRRQPQVRLTAAGRMRWRNWAAYVADEGA